MLLHAIDCLGPVTAEQLLLFVVETQQMDYIAMQLCLAELEESGLLVQRKHAVGMLYVLTGEGTDALALFRKRLPHSRLNAVRASAEAWRRRFLRERQMVSSFIRKGSGEYLVRLKLMEKDQALLEISVSVPTHEHAERFCDVWVDRATDVYAGIMKQLGEGEPPQAEAPPEM